MDLNKISKDFNIIDKLKNEIYHIMDHLRQIEYGLKVITEQTTSLDFYILIGSRRVEINPKLYYTFLQILHHSFTERLSELNEDLVKYNIGVEDEIS